MWAVDIMQCMEHHKIKRQGKGDVSFFIMGSTYFSPSWTSTTPASCLCRMFYQRSPFYLCFKLGRELQSLLSFGLEPNHATQFRVCKYSGIFHFHDCVSQFSHICHFHISLFPWKTFTQTLYYFLSSLTSLKEV